ncbi:hypothetical protein X556_0318 [Chlamydia pneumoniae B21]|nr:hypothetical protein X556_0318 [Chlamydia pneumoniae B21]
MGIEWLISWIPRHTVGHGMFTSDVSSAIKVEQTRGHNCLAPLEAYLSSLRVPISQEDLGKVHGRTPEDPFVDITPTEIVQLLPDEELSTVDEALQGVRSRLTYAYRSVEKPMIQDLALVGFGLGDSADLINFVRLANGVQNHYPHTKVKLYLAKNLADVWDCEISEEEKGQIRALGLDPKIESISLTSAGLPSVPEVATVDFMITCYGKDQEVQDPQVIQHLLNFALEETPSISVQYQEQEKLSPCDHSPEIGKKKRWNKLESFSTYCSLFMSVKNHYKLNLGIQNSLSGWLLDPYRVCAPLSSPYSCPSYLLDLQNKELRRSLLSTFLDPKNPTSETFRSVSINFGNSSFGQRWPEFLSRVLHDEKEKHVAVVCNDAKILEEGLFPEALSLLEENLRESGYSYLNILSVSPEGVSKVQERQILRRDLQGRSFTVMITDLPLGSEDIRSLQLASDRILVSSSLDAADACASGCKVLVYENPNESWAQELENFYKQVEKEALEEGRVSFREHFRAYMCDKIVAQKNFLFTLDAVIKQAGWRSQEKLNLFYVESQALGREIKVSLEEYIQSMVGILGSQRTKKKL